jgi:hypothetical protein
MIDIRRLPMWEWVRRLSRRTFVWCVLKFRHSSTKPGSGGCAEEVHCFGGGFGGRRFALFRNERLVSLGSWWTISLCLDASGELIDCRFWHNRREPGDSLLTGEKMRVAINDWYSSHPPVVRGPVSL